LAQALRDPDDGRDCRGVGDRFAVSDGDVFRIARWSCHVNFRITRFAETVGCGSLDGNVSQKLKFFVSRAGEDKEWGLWIAEILREMGHDYFLQDEHMLLGDSIVEKTREALGNCDHLIAVLSPDYLEKDHTMREFNAAVMRDPRGVKRHLMAVKVRDCTVPPDTSHQVYLSLRARDEQARRSLRAQISGERPTVKGSYRTFLGNLPAVNSLLIGREKELDFLDRAWADPAANFVQIIAAGGTGKTALVDKWFRRHLEEATVFGWSFYSQGTQEDSQTSSDPFFDEILRFFGIARPEGASPFALASAVAAKLREERVLLILDGVEPLQDAEGRVRDTALGALLHELAARQKGLVVCSTRVRVDDVPDDGARALSIELDNLEPAQGAEYLRLLKVVGTDGELREASVEYGNHALALTLLGHYLVDFCDGDVRCRIEIPALMVDDVKHGAHARRIMESYARKFVGKPELDVLKALGYFNRPAEPAALKLVLLEMSDLKLRAALKRLFEARLILGADPAKPIDCHPLVREHFAKDALPEGHSRLYEYYCKRAPQQPDTLAEMTPLFHAVYHGCRAGRHQETLDSVYLDRVMRGNGFYLRKKFGAFGTDLTLLANFFESPWTRAAKELSPASQAWTIGEAGSALRALGRLGEAVGPARLGAESIVKLQDWGNASTLYGNLCELQLTLGNVDDAVASVRLSVEYADRGHNGTRRMLARANLAGAVHQTGDAASAKRLFEEAERIEAEFHPDHPILLSTAGSKYCDLLLSEGKFVEVLRRAEKTLRQGERHYSFLSMGLDHLSLGCAQPRCSQRSVTHLDQAVDYLRRAGVLHHIAHALLARGTPDDLEEVFTIATRSGMRLHLTDYHLAMARRDPVANREHIEKAAKLIEETGYHRRDAEVAELRSKVDGLGKRAVPR